MRRYLIAYDIVDARRRNGIAARLEKAGRRIQKSVFVVETAEASLKKLEWELHGLLAAEDSLLILPLCSHCFGLARLYGSMPPLIIHA